MDGRTNAVLYVPYCDCLFMTSQRPHTPSPPLIFYFLRPQASDVFSASTVLVQMATGIRNILDAYTDDRTVGEAFIRAASDRYATTFQYVDQSRMWLCEAVRQKIVTNVVAVVGLYKHMLINSNVDVVFQTF